MAVETRYTILLIEDDPDHRLLMERCFKDIGSSQNIVTKHDGDAALEYLEKCKNEDNAELYPRPRLILLDLRLPKTDGLDVLRAVKSDRELLKIPVVVISTSDDEMDIQQAYVNKANSYLVKPKNFGEMKEVLKDVSRYWLDWNQLPA